MPQVIRTQWPQTHFDKQAVCFDRWLTDPQAHVARLSPILSVLSSTSLVVALSVQLYWTLFFLSEFTCPSQPPFRGHAQIGHPGPLCLREGGCCTGPIHAASCISLQWGSVLLRLWYGGPDSPEDSVPSFPSKEQSPGADRRDSSWGEGDGGTFGWGLQLGILFDSVPAWG